MCFSKRKKDECSICLQELNDKDKFNGFKCNHNNFHKDCINDWIEKGNGNCPICRNKSIFLEDQEVEIKESRSRICIHLFNIGYKCDINVLQDLLYKLLLVLFISFLLSICLFFICNKSRIIHSYCIIISILFGIFIFILVILFFSPIKIGLKTRGIFGIFLSAFFFIIIGKIRRWFYELYFIFIIIYCNSNIYFNLLLYSI